MGMTNLVEPDRFYDGLREIPSQKRINYTNIREFKRTLFILPQTTDLRVGGSEPEAHSPSAKNPSRRTEYAGLGR